MDRQRLTVVANGVTASIAVGLLVHFFTGVRGDKDVGSNFFLNASLFMCLGLVVLSGRLIDDPGLRGIARGCGYVGILGIALASL